ncbi:MAG: hypothetical protein K2X71_00450 [Methylobacterium sp.]|uniref:hypothetical protein n=1 Tax=Methylobacterium sp. TaxID=409 RepID=UPI002582B555|nr:hypothetical protein [Methylobacterium sp.]MBY0294506.1 hypothetical protein [Methylobacterium sp.]
MSPKDFSHCPLGSPERIATLDWSPADHLALADLHVVEGEARCARQTALIAALRAKGQDVRSAEVLLAEMEHTLAQTRTHQARLRAEQGVQ